MREHHDVTPLAWGERFHNKIVVSAPAMRLIAERGGHDWKGSQRRDPG